MFTCVSCAYKRVKMLIHNKDIYIYIIFSADSTAHPAVQQLYTHTYMICVCISCAYTRIMMLVQKKKTERKCAQQTRQLAHLVVERTCESSYTNKHTQQKLDRTFNKAEDDCPQINLRPPVRMHVPPSCVPCQPPRATRRQDHYSPPTPARARLRPPDNETVKTKSSDKHHTMKPK